MAILGVGGFTISFDIIPKDRHPVPRLNRRMAKKSPNKSVLNDPRAEAVLKRLHEAGDKEFKSLAFYYEIGRAHVCTPVTNAHLVCRLLLEQQKQPASYI